MDFAAEPLFVWLSQFAYEPLLIYSLVFLIMLLGAFGLPLPEEVAIISLGVFAYMAANPETFPPPVVNGVHAKGIVAAEAAVFCLFSVLISDLVVFMLGRVYGRRLLRVRFIARMITEEALGKIEMWTKKYGVWAAGIFRFTPGIRFPGFWTCGMGGMPIWKFLAVDGFAALISVPTQILLVAHFGESIIEFLQQVKFVVFGIIGFLLLLFFLKKFFLGKKKLS